MLIERISALAQGSNENGGSVTLVLAVALVIVLLVFVLAKTLKSKGSARNNGTPSKRRFLTADDVAVKRFMPAKFKVGYDRDEVDELLDRAARELRRLQEENERLQPGKTSPRSEPDVAAEPIITPEQVVHQKFAVARLREGYSQDEVDDFLDKIVQGLRYWNSENEQRRARTDGSSYGNAL